MIALRIRQYTQQHGPFTTACTTTAAAIKSARKPNTVTQHAVTTPTTVSKRPLLRHVSPPGEEQHSGLPSAATTAKPNARFKPSRFHARHIPAIIQFSIFACEAGTASVGLCASRLSSCWV